MQEPTEYLINSILFVVYFVFLFFINVAIQ